MATLKTNYFYLRFEVIGTTCWGHITDVQEENIRTFATNWTGTGEITGTGDAEKICLETGEYMESEVFYTDAFTIEILQNVYLSGDNAALKYRHGNTSAACLAASWISYTGQFMSLGYVQIRLEGSS